MDHDADKPEERTVNPVKESEGLVVDLSALWTEDAAETREVEVPTTLPRSHDDAPPYNEEHVLFDECEDENLTSQLAVIRSFTASDIIRDESLCLENECVDNTPSGQLAAEQSEIKNVAAVTQDEPAPPEPAVAVKTPSLIRRIAGLIFGGFR